MALGVSVDFAQEAGIGMLKRFGPFDEILVGRGWQNLAALRYVWGDLPGPAAVPQILVLDRKVLWDGATLSVTEERRGFAS